jgi:dynein intermediate chain
MLQSIATQTDAAGPAPSPPEPAPEPKRETVTYSKGVQTDDLIFPPGVSSDNPLDLEDGETSPANKILSRRERERDEEIRERLRKEIEEELQATKQMTDDGPLAPSAQLRYPLRTLTDDELNAVTSSGDFLDFVERSSKVIERALDEEYDVLADYELGGVNADEEEDEEYGKKKRGIKEVAQFWDERWSKKRMISDLSFSPKVRPADGLTSNTGD